MHIIRFKRLRRSVVLAGVLAAAALAPLPALSADTGTVAAQVFVGTSPCITITSPSNAAPVEFGSLPFSTTPGSSVGNGTPDISITNCATTSESLLASGTNATGANNAVWTLSSTLPNQCTVLNTYRLSLRDPNAAELFLTTNNQSVGTLGTTAGTTTITRTPRITMPCTGSSGSGQTMSMSFNFTATIP